MHRRASTLQRLRSRSNGVRCGRKSSQTLRLFPNAARSQADAPLRRAFVLGKSLESARGRDGLIKLAIINGGVNAAIRYAGIQQALVEYPWSSAAAIFTTRRGSCMEFAIAKYIALLQSEWPSNDIRLVLAWPDGGSEPHMVLAARYEGGWYILDNLRSAILSDIKLENYVPLFVLDHLGVRKLVPEFTATDSAARDARADAYRRRMITTELRNNEPRPDGGTP